MDVFATYLQNALSKLDGIKVEMVATTKQDRIYNKQKNGDFDLAVKKRMVYFNAFDVKEDE